MLTNNQQLHLNTDLTTLKLAIIGVKSAKPINPNAIFQRRTKANLTPTILLPKISQLPIITKDTSITNTKIDIENLRKLKVTELKELLKERGLKTIGNKDDLIKRLYDYEKR